MRVRRATAADQDSVQDLQSRIFTESDRVPVSSCHWWIAEDGVKPVGFAGLRDIGDNIGFLCLSGVLPGARGNGLQRRMIHARTRWAKVSGFSTVITYTLVSNPASSNSLIGAGFRLYDPEIAWLGRTLLYWKKELT